MSAPEIFVLFAWLVMPLHALAFLVLFGWPWRYQDKTMAWHLWVTTAVAGIEPLGFLVSGISVWPAAAIYAGSLMVMWWRIGLLWRTRRRAKLARSGETGRS